MFDRLENDGVLHDPISIQHLMISHYASSSSGGTSPDRMLHLKLMDFALATNVDAMFFTTQAGVRAQADVRMMA